MGEDSAEVRGTQRGVRVRGGVVAPAAAAVAEPEASVEGAAAMAAPADVGVAVVALVVEVQEGRA